jgi:hypothetical protein
MAGEPNSPNNWTDFFVGLPAPLQGVFVVVVAAVVGWFGYRAFVKRLLGEAPASVDYAVGDPTTFADMSSVKKLVAQVDLLTMQMMKSAVATDGHTALLSRLCDLVAQLLVDLREDRERDELETERRRGYEDGLRDAEATQVRHRPPTSSARKTPRGG